MSNYDDIIHLPHHVSRKRKRMSLHDRAAQFAPFAALVGYDAAVEETARLTGQRIELDENEKQLLDARLRVIEEHLGEDFQVSITYFVPDERKDGGSYRTETGVVKKILHTEQLLHMSSGTKIAVSDILSISFSLAT